MGLGLGLSSGGAPFSIQQLSPAAWYRADPANLTIATGVSQWADLSGNSRPLLQATGAKQPTSHSTGGANNQPYVAFAKASSQFMQASFTLNQNWELFTVAQWGALASGDTLIDGTLGNTARIYINSTSGPDVYFNASPGTIILHENTVTISSWQRYNARWAGTSGAASVGTTACTQQTGTGIGTNNAGGITLGAFGTGSSSFANVNISEVIAFSRILASADRSHVVSYLQNRYSIS